MCSNRSGSTRYLLTYGSLTALAGILLICFTPLLYDALYRIVTSLAFPITYNAWRNVPVRMKFFFFNWTNPDDIRKSNVKPHFQEIGPFVFEEVRQKVNISWNQNNTITYNILRYWYFVESESSFKLSTNITTINMLAIFAANYIRNWHYIARKGFDISTKVLSTKLSKVTTVDKLLFSGYEDPIIQLADVLELDLPTSFYDKFALLYKQNGSYTVEGTMNMVFSGQNLGIIKNWNYHNYSKIYNSCKAIGGSGGEFFSRSGQRDTIDIFIPDICRYATLDYESDDTYEGTNGYKYIFGDSFFDNGTNIPDNKCYCGQDCVPYGAISISRCKYGVPLYISQPHFYGVDPFFLHKISGLNPIKTKHQMFAVIEPGTGFLLNLEGRMQLNVMVNPVKPISLLENVPSFLFPIMWCEEQLTIPTLEHYFLKIFLCMPLILRCMGVILMVIELLILNQRFIEQLFQKSKKKSQPIKICNEDSGSPEKPLLIKNLSKKFDRR